MVIYCLGVSFSVGNSIEYRFTCCQGDPSAPGCSVGKVGDHYGWTVPHTLCLTSALIERKVH